MMIDKSKVMLDAKFLISDEEARLFRILGKPYSFGKFEDLKIAKTLERACEYVNAPKKEHTVEEIAAALDELNVLCLGYTLPALEGLRAALDAMFNSECGFDLSPSWRM